MLFFLFFFFFLHTLLWNLTFSLTDIDHAIVEPYGLHTKIVYRNAAASILYEQALARETGSALTSTGALVTSSGHKTGLFLTRSTLFAFIIHQLYLSYCTILLHFSPKSMVRLSHHTFIPFIFFPYESISFNIY